ncbi:hypothetical protein PIB30_001582 [Stylosanthes scabra]|uniref:Uncharacterized protein n=1 Tax=Stylosanthes scabra TaxID=79078 RepID=A0ABU6S289_9FABA|nr:hypothetical protein [Stylosanthes scabra]
MEVLSMFQRPRSVALEYEKPGTYGTVLIYPLDRLRLSRYIPSNLQRKHVKFVATGTPPHASVHSTISKESENLEGKCTKIESYDFNQGLNYHQLLKFMLDWRLADEPVADDYNMRKRGIWVIESLLLARDPVRFLVQHHMVDVIVITTGGIEEDLIKCLAPTYKGEFFLNGAYLRSKELNRIGNLLVPNDNYCKFEDWIIPIFYQMLTEQNNENNIPVFCPGLTDGSSGDMLYFHSFCNPGFIVGIVQGSSYSFLNFSFLRECELCRMTLNCSILGNVLRGEKNIF